MKILTAHQSAYLPWLGYFHKIALCDTFVVLDNVQFEKNSFINRNKVKGPNGEFWLTVPVSLKGHISGVIKDVSINDRSWQKKHLKTIELNYKRAPYFDQYINFFRDCYSRDWDSIALLSQYMLEWYLGELKINVEIKKMSDYSFKEKKANLVLAICKQFEADAYIFGALGKGYVEENIFTEESIKLYFQDYKHPSYKQQYGEFASHLGILDLLFNCGEESADILFCENITKEELIKLCSQ